MNTNIAFPTKINFKKTNFKDYIYKYRKLLIIVAILVLFLFTVKKIASKKPNPVTSNGDSRVTVQGAKASFDINKEFLFPLKDDKGKDLTQIKYLIEKAELRNEIIVKGQRAVAVKGKSFLILSLKVTNTYDRAIQINTRDYLRLSINGNKNELLAANIHNDPVSIQAISTQPVRLGFAINDTDIKLTLLVGEIKGEKQEIELNLK